MNGQVVIEKKCGCMCYKRGAQYVWKRCDVANRLFNQWQSTSKIKYHNEYQKHFNH